jgi:hypothetical protein
MRRVVLALLLAATIVPAADARARSSSRSSSHSTPRSTRTAKAKPRSARSLRCTSCVRDSRGRIARSASAKHAFQKSHPCPSTGKTTGACKGYVIDHVVPLKRGGADSPSNMQWQTVQAAKAKDKVEWA